MINNSFFLRNIAVLSLLASIAFGVPALAARATFGYDGGAGSYFNTANRIRGIIRTAPDDGIVDSIYVLVAGVASGAVAKGVLYDSTAMSLVDSSAQRTLSSDGGSFHWEGFAFQNSGSIEAGSKYMMGIFVGSSYVGVTRVSTSDSRYYVDYTYANGVPLTLSGGNWASDQVHSIYVVYHTFEDSAGVQLRRRRVLGF